MESKAPPATSPANTLELSDKPWLLCRGCGDEVRALVPSGVCFRCVEVRESEQRQKIAVNEGMKSMIGLKGAQEFTFEAYRVSPGTERAFAAARNFVPTAENLFLYGPAGTGKTHLAGAIVRKWLWERGPQNVEFHKVPELLRWFQLRKPSERTEEIKRLARLHVLVLDDLGVEKDTEHALGVLYEIIDARIMARRNGLVITSNLSPEDLAKKMDDDRLPSRIFGMCSVYRLDGPDGRIEARKP